MDRQGRQAEDEPHAPDAARQVPGPEALPVLHAHVHPGLQEDRGAGGGAVQEDGRGTAGANEPREEDSQVAPGEVPDLPALPRQAGVPHLWWGGHGRGGLQREGHAVRRRPHPHDLGALRPAAAVRRCEAGARPAARGEAGHEEGQHGLRLLDGKRHEAAREGPGGAQQAHRREGPPGPVPLRGVLARGPGERHPGIRRRGEGVLRRRDGGERETCSRALRQVRGPEARRLFRGPRGLFARRLDLRQGRLPRVQARLPLGRRGLRRGGPQGQQEGVGVRPRLPLVGVLRRRRRGGPRAEWEAEQEPEPELGAGWPLRLPRAWAGAEERRQQKAAAVLPLAPPGEKGREAPGLLLAVAKRGGEEEAQVGRPR
mmetsp:Transcript_107639/g.321940  ORF Transcript_107639/g.321940 Transcript_107639/m.321940 type:complete len:371 (-) Transcript_107639:70-1182(-)